VAVLVALVTEGPLTAGLVLLAVVVVQQVESQAVAPVVLDAPWSCTRSP
jgi:predicted PurR-regulated permease PerM